MQDKSHFIIATTMINYFWVRLKSVSNLSNNLSINNDQLVNYLNFGTTINPNTFENVQAVLPGECIKFSFDSNQQIIKMVSSIGNCLNF